LEKYLKQLEKWKTFKTFKATGKVLKIKPRFPNFWIIMISTFEPQK
jgi:hypothetical protein